MRNRTHGGEVPKYLYHSEMGAALPSNPLLDGTPTLRHDLPGRFSREKT